MTGVRLIAVSAAVGVLAVLSMAAGATAKTACTKARIGGRPACLAAGQSCRPKYATAYRKYGFSCTQPNRRAHHRLVKLSYTF